MPTERILFPGSLGVNLAARWDLPDKPAKSHVLFAHCFTCSKNLRAVVNISKALNDLDIAVFRFDFTGLGESEGDFADTNFSSNVEDLLAAADFMADKGDAPAMLIGHSLGGAAILEAGPRLESVKALVTIGAPHDPAHVAHLLSSKRDEIERDGVAKVRLGGRTFAIKKQFLDDLESSSHDGKVRDLRRALLVMHSPIDDIVGIDNAAQIFQAAKHPKSFVSLDTADHLLSKEEDSHYAAHVLAAWASRYIPCRGGS